MANCSFAIATQSLCSDVLSFEKEDTFATVTELAKHLSISKQQMSPIIDKLVKKNLLKTCLSKDRRYSQISLSEKGRNF